MAAAKAAPDSLTFGSPPNGTTIHLAGEILNTTAGIKMGAVRPLAVTSATRSSALPEVPTVAESGYPGFDVSTWYGLFVPAQTPREVVTRVNAEVNKLLAQPAVREAISAQGAEAKAMTPEEFGRQVSAELPVWKGIVERSGAKLE